MELNKKVIIRADRAGVFYGTIIRKDGDEVELKDCRRIWYWNGAASLSELALSGVKRDGNTLKEAVADAEAKEMEDMPIKERVAKFVEVFGSMDSGHTGKEFYDWHHILTGSCRMGRDEFCKAHNVDLTKKYTVKYFLDLTKGSYGSNVIKQVRESYKSMEE